MRDFLKKLGVLLIVALVIGVIVTWPRFAHADPAPHYTDGTQCDGGIFCNPILQHVPPPLDPKFDPEPGGNCTTLVVDPPSFVFVTIHVVYGTTAPPAGTTPVHDDASKVVNYVGSAPGTFLVGVFSLVDGQQGFIAYTWNIGLGVTSWVPFDCRPAPTTTTSIPMTTTTECPDHTLPCAGPPVTDTTSTTIGTSITATTTPATVPVARPIVAQPVTTG